MPTTLNAWLASVALAAVLVTGANAAEYRERVFAAESAEPAEACEMLGERARRHANSLWALDHLDNCVCERLASETQRQRCEIRARYRTTGPS